jgi:hypothetical protein
VREEEANIEEVHYQGSLSAAMSKLIVIIGITETKAAPSCKFDVLFEALTLPSPFPQTASE